MSTISPPEWDLKIIDLMISLAEEILSAQTNGKLSDSLPGILQKMKMLRKQCKDYQA